MQQPNPKKMYGDKKPPLHLLPLAGMIHQAMAHMDGNLKYGFENWNGTSVEKLTYIGAILRHTELYKYGENYTRDTLVHNLGAVMACCAILIDAELNDRLIDNTRHSPATCDLLQSSESTVQHLKDMQAERERDAAVQDSKPIVGPIPPASRTWIDVAMDQRKQSCQPKSEWRADKFDRAVKEAKQRIDNEIKESRQTFVVPIGWQAERDVDGRATGAIVRAVVDTERALDKVEFLIDDAGGGA